MQSAVLDAGLLGRAPQTTFLKGSGALQKCHATFDEIFAAETELKLLATADSDLFHEAGVWVRENGQDKIFVTSNRLTDANGAPEIKMCTITLPSSPTLKQNVPKSNTNGVKCQEGVEYTALDQLPIVMANGATKYGSNILVCSQGMDHSATKDGSFTPSALILVDPKDYTKATPLLNHFHGRVFNSLNDVFVHEPSGCILFTDPDYGYEQKFKRKPDLPNAVWSFNIKDESVKMIGDGIKKPNGIVCSPDGKTCYVTDTDFVHGDGTLDGARPGTIYAFDIITQSGGHPVLQNKRLFAFVDCGAPDGIKCDTNGIIYTGCFDGVHIFDPMGNLLGRICLPPTDNGDQRGCANLVFGPDGRLIILSETTIWEIQTKVTGALGAVDCN